MFRQLIAAFRKTDALAEMFSQFAEMLQAGRWMFNTAAGVVAKTTVADEVRDELFARDRSINRLERSIRERIVVHLVTDHDQDVGICLILMSVVKDAERIGDYCKNIFQIGEMFQGEYSRAEYTRPLADMTEQIDGLFPMVSEAFADAIKDQSKRAVSDSVVIRKQCDMLLGQLLAPGGTTPPDEAAALALRVRFLKRIAAHLGNIATSVNNPVPMLDYNGKKPLDEPES